MAADLIINRPSQGLAAYACGTLRQPIVQSMAHGSRADSYFPAATAYQGGNSIIWGLVRGARGLMQQTRAAGNDFFQMDNAYFGRNRYFRVTKNAVQLTQIETRERSQFEMIFRELGLVIRPWKVHRSGPIVVCLSSRFLYEFYGMDIQQALDSVLADIKQTTNRPIVVRAKEAELPIDLAIADAWCVVTHVSVAALDALRLGIPVVTLGKCAATPLATPLCEIERPRMLVGRENLFASLAYGQFTPEEMRSGLAWEIVSGTKNLRPNFFPVWLFANHTGTREHDKIVCVPGLHKKGHCLFGLDYTVGTDGTYQASFEIEFDACPLKDIPAIVLDVYENFKTNRVLAERRINVQEGSPCMKVFDLVFVAQLGQRIEFRIFWQGTCSMKAHGVLLERLA